MSSEKITLNLSDAENKLNDIAIDSINIAIKDLEKIEKYNKNNLFKNKKDNSYEEIRILVKEENIVDWL